ncbi:MAG TPA: hypothetical protein VN426_05640 [Syntrophomonadaceae bacterium]|nr:hypothetical protein [Syntrophomonadaceae bacterium]
MSYLQVVDFRGCIKVQRSEYKTGEQGDGSLTLTYSPGQLQAGDYLVKATVGGVCFYA